MAPFRRLSRRFSHRTCPFLKTDKTGDGEAQITQRSRSGFEPSKEGLITVFEVNLFVDDRLESMLVAVGSLLPLVFAVRAAPCASSRAVLSYSSFVVSRVIVFDNAFHCLRTRTSVEMKPGRRSISSLRQFKVLLLGSKPSGIKGAFATSILISSPVSCSIFLSASAITA